MVIRLFLQFFGNYHDFYRFYYGSKMVEYFTTTLNNLRMVACSYYYHEIFQKNNL